MDDYTRCMEDAKAFLDDGLSKKKLEEILLKNGYDNHVVYTTLKNLGISPKESYNENSLIFILMEKYFYLVVFLLGMSLIFLQYVLNPEFESFIKVFSIIIIPKVVLLTFVSKLIVSIMSHKSSWTDSFILALLVTLVFSKYPYISQAGLIINVVLFIIMGVIIMGVYGIDYMKAIIIAIFFTIVCAVANHLTNLLIATSV